MKNLFFPILLSVCLTVFIYGCDKKTVQQPKSLPLVYTAAAVERDVDRGTTVIGTVVSEDTVDLYARVQGFLVKQDFADGSNVAAGQLLFEIEPDLYEANTEHAQAQLASAEATLHRAQLDLTRQQKLQANDANSQREVEFAEAAEKTAAAAVAQAQADLKTARLDLSYTKISAPFDGLIGYSKYAPGSLVGPSSGALATIVKLNPIQVDFAISEADLLTLRRFAAQKDLDLVISIYLQDDTLYPVQGKLIAKDNKIDQETGTIMLRAQFDNPDGELLPGMYVRVSVRPAGKYQMLMIPTVALNTDIEGDYVFVVDAQNKVIRKNIVHGAADGDWTIVREGLEPGEQVITSGVQKTRSGSEVEARPDPAFVQTTAALPAEVSK